MAISAVLVLDGATSGGFWYGYRGAFMDDPAQVAVRNFVCIAPIKTDNKGVR